MFQRVAKLIQKYRKKQISLTNTFDVLRPINILSNILGFRIFEYPRGHSRPRLSLLYMTILSCVYYSGWYYHGLLLNVNSVFNLHEALYNITGAIDQVTIFVILTVGLHQTKSLKQSTRRIHEIDITLQALGSPSSFNIIYKRTMAMLLFVFFFQILNTSANVYVYLSFPYFISKTLQVVLYTFVHLYGLTVEFILIIEFLVMMCCIGSGFRRANDLLSDLNVLPQSSIAMELLDQQESNDSFSKNKWLHPSPNKLFTLLPSSQRLRLQLTSHGTIRSRRLLQTIRQIHLELYRVWKSIGIIYGIQISMEMGLCILYTTYYIYNFYDRYQDEEYDSLVLIIGIVATCTMCFQNAIKIFCVNYTCERITREAVKTSEIISTFYGQSTDYEIQEEVKAFSLQMKQCRPSYSAFSLYSLNCKNVCSCIGIITTYVVIMIQVTNSTTAEVS